MDSYLRLLGRQRASSLLVAVALLVAACSGGGSDEGVVLAGTPPPTTPDVSLPDAAAGGHGLNAALPPGGNFDLSKWKLTLPSGQEIKAATLAGGYTLADVFYTDPLTGGMVFKCPNIAGTTPNSQFSRTELREMLAPDGPAYAVENNWTTTTGGTLRATLRVDRVSTTGEAKKVGRVIVGQIHAEKTEVIRLYYHKRPDEPKGRIYAGMDSVDNVNTWSPDIVGNRNGEGIALGEVFTYEIRLAGSTLTVDITQASGRTTTYVRTIDPGYAGQKLYFKAGVYNQNNTGESADYVQATFFALRQAH